MITSIVILAAFYQIGADLSDIQVQKQLDSESIELKAAIDDIGSVSPDSIRQSSTYEFSTDFPANAFISGEYIRFETTYLDKTVHSVKPLTFRTLAHNETEMRKLLSNNFNGQTGTAEDPITTDTNTALELLSSVSRQELMLNTEKIVHIEKTSIYLKNDPEVRQLEIVLVYQ
ncbi:hypothetical protein MCMEM_0491 [Methanococcoides methylutens MM1]|uniref:Uncharacterized protein n=2 Tax=Methanococcoides methylutens TaxID=2226 RepID=A0A0E3WZ63_METMT|nr:hypothetical protein MCMEM_0491 [Methanococcoides methylutens MM1]